MEIIYPELDQRISEMSEGDKEFKKELILAIYQGLVELKQIYAKGLSEKDDHQIQQVRHKIKPTLTIFELSHIVEELQIGKVIIENEGFDSESFDTHYQNLQGKLDQAIQRVFELTE